MFIAIIVGKNKFLQNYRRHTKQNQYNLLLFVIQVLKSRITNLFKTEIVPKNIWTKIPREFIFTDLSEGHKNRARKFLCSYHSIKKGLEI